jgi:hypothetical protein
MTEIGFGEFYEREREREREESVNSHLTPLLPCKRKHRKT